MGKDGSFSKPILREEPKISSKTGTTVDLKNCISKRLKSEKDPNDRLSCPLFSL
jgi:hypothetical protein